MIDPQLFKQSLGMFGTGVALATTALEHGCHGVTANAVMSVSLDPPLVLLSIQIGTRMHHALNDTDNFALNILSAAQRSVAQHFADSSVSHGTEALATLPHHAGVTGAPLLDEALACVDCRIVQRYPAGDHMLYLGEVLHIELGRQDEPLLYYRGHFL